MPTEQLIKTQETAFTGQSNTVQCYIAAPEGQQSKPAVILIHEWWGLNPHIKDIAERFARAGFYTVAVDLYEGKTTKDAGEAGQLMSNLAPATALNKLEIVVNALRATPDISSVGVTGFCMGGVYSLLTACKLPVEAAVPFYGIPDDLSCIADLRCPILFFGGEKDQWITVEKMTRLREAIASHQKDGEVIIYSGADHAFFNDTRPEVYSESDAQDAWDRTLTFFGQHLEVIMLQNSVAIITGASSGIGAATALELGKRGARLCLLGRDSARLNVIAEQARTVGAEDVFALEADVRDEAAMVSAVQETLSRYARIDILINSAGLSLNGSVNGYALDDWRTVIDTNLTGTFLTCRAVLPSMLRQQQGQIINIASGAGRNGIKNMSAYCASKFGVIGFSESLALEVRNENIRVSVIIPGSIASNFSNIANRKVPNETNTNEAKKTGYSLFPSEIATVIANVLEQPMQVWMSEVVVRPLNVDLQRNET